MDAPTDTPTASASRDAVAQPPVQSPPADSNLIALYSENGEIARAIMEWRHRVITLYVLMLGGVGSTVLWLQKNKALRDIPLPFFLASIIVSVLGLMDHT